MTNESRLIDSVYELAQRLKLQGVTEGDIAEAGGMRRQSINARGIDKRTSGERTERLGFGFAVIRAAFQNGRREEVLSILAGHESVVSTALRVAVIFPDVTSDELAVIENTEKMLNTKPLSEELITSLITTYRAPKR